MDKKAALDIVSINELQLQEECVTLPTYYLRASFNASELRNQLSQKEIELKQLEGQVAKDVRDNPARHGIEKVTVAAVDEVVASHKPLVAKRGEVQAIRFELDQAQGVLAALEMKKRALTNLVQLYSMSYHGGVKGDKDSRDAVERQTGKEVTERIKKRRANWADEEKDEE